MRSTDPLQRLVNPYAHGGAAESRPARAAGRALAVGALGLSAATAFTGTGLAAEDGSAAGSSEVGPGAEEGAVHADLILAPPAVSGVPDAGWTRSGGGIADDVASGARGGRTVVIGDWEVTFSGGGFVDARNLVTGDVAESTTFPHFLQSIRQHAPDDAQPGPDPRDQGDGTWTDLTPPTYEDEGVVDEPPIWQPVEDTGSPVEDLPPTDAEATGADQDDQPSTGLVVAELREGEEMARVPADEEVQPPREVMDGIGRGLYENATETDPQDDDVVVGSGRGFLRGDGTWAAGHRAPRLGR